MRLFALDQNFPLPIVEVLAEYQEHAELVSVKAIDRRLSELDDWEVVMALHHHERPWDGLITCDTGMLAQPRELSVLMQTKFTLVNARRVGHNPVKATGLVFAYLEGICKKTRPDKAQIWVIAAADRAETDPWELLRTVADHRSVEAAALYDDHKLNDYELQRDPLALS